MLTMRVVLSCVKEANVTIDNNMVGQISRGFLLLVGFTEGDNEEIIDKMIDKIIGLRVFPDENGNTNICLSDINGSILSVSQFTLYADASHGRRPSFIDAMRPEKATVLYDYFNEQLTNKFGHIEKGVFGADMKVYSINDGPFTLILDSKDIVR